VKAIARLLAVLLAVSAPASAALNTGAAFLKLDPSARSAALGSAYTAMSGTADAMFFNPAGLAGLGRRELMAGHAEWLAGTKFDALAYGQPLGWGTLGVSALRLSAGDLDARTADRRSAGTFEAADSMYSLSGARRFEAATFGAALKYLKSEIGPYSAQTVAVDLGARRDIPGRPLSLGVAVRNLGKGLKFLEQEDALPLTVSAGASYRLAGVLGVALDVRHEPNDSRTSVSIGTEYAFLGSLALRAGYGANMLTRSGSTQGPLGGLGAGLGFRFRSFGADYAFTPFGELGDVQRLSLSARF
jgi:hypothetical protein